MGTVLVVSPLLPTDNAETIPPIHMTWEAADPSAGVADLISQEQAALDAEIARWKAAETARKARAARRATPKPRTSRSAPGGNVLARIRACESGGRYDAVSASGKYRGAYQFDRRTWASVGGSGDPAAASPEEQDARAAALMASRGSNPWPNC